MNIPIGAPWAVKRRRRRRGAVFMHALAVAMLLLGSGTVGAQDYDLAAKVNGKGITRARLQSSLDASMQQKGMDYGGITQPKQYKRRQRQILDQLIAQELLWQEASRQGFVPSPAEVDAALARVRDDFETELSYRNELERNGFTDESYREDMKRRITVRRWVRESLVKDITISDEEVHGFYVTNEPRFVQPEQVRARHVLIKVPAGADDAVVAAAREEIDRVLAEAKAGADFAELAKTYSQGPTAPRGGDLGFLARGRLVESFEDAAFALAPGEISDVVRTQYGFHVIKLEARREKQVVSEAQAAPSIREHLFSGKVQDAIEARVATLRKQGSVEILIPL